MKRTDVQIDRKVIYTPFFGCSNTLLEEGVITGKNEKYVFVRYGNDVHSQATKAEDIDYLWMTLYNQGINK